MTNHIADSYIYENLLPVYKFNEQTKLCVYEPTKKLYIVKTADLSYKDGYEAILNIKNPHLAKLHYISVQKDHIEIVREYVSGDTLSDLLKGGITLDPDIAVKIATDICIGLSDMHKAGYVHRDINPNNIIIDSDFNAKIIDFGIIRSFSENKPSDTMILGTPGYAAPEQFGFSQSDAKTDIYAVGVLLNVMITGKLPNEQKADGKLGKIITKCIKIDSSHRYKNIDQLKNVLSAKIDCKNGPIDNFFSLIPGFRSRKIPIMILSIIGYILAFLLSAGYFAIAHYENFLQYFISWILWLPVPFVCFSNFFGIWDKFSFSKESSKRSQKILYTIIGIVSIICGILATPT